MEGRRSVAVHVPGSGGGDSVALQYLTLAEQAVARGLSVWLVTESQAVVDRYRARFGEAVHCLDALRSETGEGLYLSAASADRLRLAEEAIGDVLIAASCDRFVGNGAAAASCMVDFLMGADRTRKHLFLPNRYRRRDLTLYED